MLGQRERMVQLLHLGRLCDVPRVLRTNRAPRAKQRGKKP